MPSQKKSTIKVQQHHLIKDIDFTGKSTNGETRIGLSPDNKIIEYFQLQKQASRWNGIDQIHFAQDAERRANALIQR